jgi:hypothetical protein
LEDVDAVLHGLHEGGTLAYIRDGVTDVARRTLSGRPLAAALARLREVTGSPEFAQELALDVLARTGPLDRTDAETLTAAIRAAGSATVYQLGEELLAAVVGGA